jgi:hypothetical protein
MNKVYIPSPCPMIYSKMDPVVGGRFCGGCNKTVFDVTEKSPDELISFLKEKGTDVCVSALSDQLAPFHRTPWFKIKFVAAVVLSFFGFQMKPMAQAVKEKPSYPVVYKHDKDKHLKELKCYQENDGSMRRLYLFRKKRKTPYRTIGCPSF